MLSFISGILASPPTLTISYPCSLYLFSIIFISASGILIAYWGILWIGGGEDPYSLEHNLIRKIDIFLLGESHLYGGTGIQFDPEGLLSTIPSVVTVLIGYLVGSMLHTTKDFLDNVKRMSTFGIGLMIVGIIWGASIPNQ